jgi:hypothetical protein
VESMVVAWHCLAERARRTIICRTTSQKKVEARCGAVIRLDRVESFPQDDHRHRAGHVLAVIALVRVTWNGRQPFGQGRIARR